MEVNTDEQTMVVSRFSAGSDESCAWTSDLSFLPEDYDVYSGQSADQQTLRPISNLQGANVKWAALGRTSPPHEPELSAKRARTSSGMFAADVAPASAHAGGGDSASPNTQPPSEEEQELVEVIYRCATCMVVHDVPIMLAKNPATNCRHAQLVAQLESQGAAPPERPAHIDDAQLRGERCLGRRRNIHFHAPLLALYG